MGQTAIRKHKMITIYYTVTEKLQYSDITDSDYDMFQEILGFFLFSEYDPDLSPSVIIFSLGQVLPQTLHEELLLE